VTNQIDPDLSRFANIEIGRVKIYENSKQNIELLYLFPSNCLDSELPVVQIPEEVIRLLIRSDNVVFIGSVDKQGMPNISPRFVLGIVGDNSKLLFGDLFENKTFTNLVVWNKVTASVVDKDTMGGFQLKGEASEVTDDDLVTLANSKLKEHGFGSKPHRVWVLDVKEIFSAKPSGDSKAPLISAYG
jgi:predicted pyridoxine 5'-phosphate oxidase superfamily flavin-nucleotide-binding protein